ncbi:putative reverse transcriptase domain-containing protein [Tanacetum coccineum]|uniref:Reverse transcriptase domain-containing protein n=1 Tax=Tanacetum coccineum TaxID=301880 RepID=A0ABQ5AQ44_9ASTR
MEPKKITTRASPATTTTTTPVTNGQLKALIDQGVADALAARDADRSRNGNDNHNSGTGSRRIERIAHECTYTDFLKCQPMNFKGTEGVVGLTQWFERMETVFNISNCVVENQVKFATCTIHGVALTWWKSHVKKIGQDAAHDMPWNTLMKMMTAKYRPQNKIKKLEMEIWELKVKGIDLASYTQCFQELALMCRRMFPEESDKIEKYVGGLLDMIHGSVMTSKPKTMQDAVEFATELMDKKIRTFVERQTENKRKSPTNANTANNQRGTRAGQKATCFECRAQGHFKRECPKLKNNNRGNQGRNGNVPAKVYVVGNAGTNPDSNVVTGTFLLNNRYAYILFDTGADRSFVSTAFRSQIDITPTTLDHYYDVELTDGKIIRINTIIRCHNWYVLVGKVPCCHCLCQENRLYSLGNETLIVRGNGSNQGNKTRLNIISCTKTQKYMLKGCHVFLAHVTTKKTEDKSEGKRLEDIDLMPCATPVARAPYRLAPSEMKELNKKEHEEHLKAILELLKKEELYAKFSKCEFLIPKVQFLNHVIDSQGIPVDPAKIESIKDWASPKTPTKLR